jgi:hypothetical protein
MSRQTPRPCARPGLHGVYRCDLRRLQEVASARVASLPSLEACRCVSSTSLTGRTAAGEARRPSPAGRSRHSSGTWRHRLRLQRAAQPCAHPHAWEVGHRLGRQPGYLLGAEPERERRRHPCGPHVCRLVARSRPRRSCRPIPSTTGVLSVIPIAADYPFLNILWSMIIFFVVMSAQRRRVSCHGRTRQDRGERQGG